MLVTQGSGANQKTIIIMQAQNKPAVKQQVIQTSSGQVMQLQQGGAGGQVVPGGQVVQVSPGGTGGQVMQVSPGSTAGGQPGKQQVVQLQQGGAGGQVVP